MRCALAGLLLGLSGGACAIESPRVDGEPPRVQALLEQAWSAESGEGYNKDRPLALALYCQAGLSGSTEGYYRIGLLYRNAPSEFRDEGKAAGYFALAAQLGHERAASLIAGMRANAIELEDCSGFEHEMEEERFDMPRYIAGLPGSRQSVAEIIRAEAERQAVPVPLALAIACAESNLNARAVSPRNAQGVMQLIPDTQERFGVRDPFDVRQNVRGGLRYIKWLLEKFEGNVAHVAAAYNAGEGNVQRYRGIPPFAETRAYVTRVLFYAGMTHG